MSKKKLGILGCGKLNTIVAEATVNGILEEYEIIGVYSLSLIHIFTVFRKNIRMI